MPMTADERAFTDDVRRWLAEQQVYYERWKSMQFIAEAKSGRKNPLPAIMSQTRTLLSIIDRLDTENVDGKEG